MKNTANSLYNALVDYANLLDDKDELDVEDIKKKIKHITVLNNKMKLIIHQNKLLLKVLHATK